MPKENAGKFLNAAKRIIIVSKSDLLNVTVRDIEEDKDVLLKYADQHVLAFVMFFSQPRNAAGDAQMQQMTRELIDAALNAGGRYYLPYRLHATGTQFRRAYPQAEKFFALKRKYDPREIFQNQFYSKYSSVGAAE